MTGAVILVVALVGATAFGLWWRWSSGRVVDRRSVTSVAPVPMAGPDEPPAEIGAPAVAPASGLADALAGRTGERVTMVQFSSAFCQPCRATRRILEEVAVLVPGVAHVEIDAEHNLDLVRELDVRRTPTVLFVDSAGVVRKQASGQPRKADVIAALGELVGPEDFEI
jgi:thiol-disulfide isomerase/thioredoxin